MPVRHQPLPRIYHFEGGMTEGAEVVSIKQIGRNSIDAINEFSLHFSLHLHGPLIVPCSVFSVAEARSVAESRSHPQQSMTSYHSQSRLRHARKVQVPPRWAHVSLKGFGHQRLDQRSLLADGLRTAT